MGSVARIFAEALADAFGVAWDARTAWAEEERAFERFCSRARPAVAPLQLREGQFAILTQNAFLHYRYGLNDEEVYLANIRQMLVNPGCMHQGLLARLGWLGDEADLLTIGKRAASAAAEAWSPDVSDNTQDDEVIRATILQTLRTMRLLAHEDSDALVDLILDIEFAVEDPYSLWPARDVFGAQVLVDELMSGEPIPPVVD